MNKKEKDIRIDALIKKLKEETEKRCKERDEEIYRGLME